MAQTKLPDAKHILYMFSIKFFSKIYPFYAPFFKKCITAYEDFKVV